MGPPLGSFPADNFAQSQRRTGPGQRLGASERSRRVNRTWTSSPPVSGPRRHSQWLRLAVGRTPWTRGTNTSPPGCAAAGRRRRLAVAAVVAGRWWSLRLAQLSAQLLCSDPLILSQSHSWRTRLMCQQTPPRPPWRECWAAAAWLALACSPCCSADRSPAIPAPHHTRIAAPMPPQPLLPRGGRLPAARGQRHAHLVLPGGCCTGSCAPASPGAALPRPTQRRRV